MSKLNLIFFNISKELQVISDLSDYYEKKEDYEVEFIKNPAEVSQYIQTSGNGIVMFKVASKADLQVAVDFLRTQKKAIKKGVVKPACIMMVKNKKVEKVLAKYGCQELLDENMRAKTLSFKVDFWARNVKSTIEKIEREKENRLKAKSLNNGGKDGRSNDKKTDFESVPALQLQSDTWLIKNKSDAKKILKRYLIRVLGPSPHIGGWFELEPQPGDSMPTWKYVLKSQDDQQFILEDGAWYFSGSKPEFDWKANRWNFSSDAPHLYFYTSEGEVFSRFKYSEGKVEVAENSTFAKTKEEMILETCDTKFNFDGEKAQDEESETLDGENEGEEINGNLEGATEGEDARDDLLSGKTKGDDEDDLGGNYSGKSKSSDIEEEAAQAKKGEGFEEDDLGGNYSNNGKSSEDDEIEQARKKGNLDLKDAKKGGIDADVEEEGDVGGHWGGKIKQTNKDDEAEAKKKRVQFEEKSREGGIDADVIDEGDVGGHYGGKGSTDQIDDDPLSGKMKRAQLKDPEKAKEHEGIDEGDVGGHYDGKGSTDQLDNDPMSGKLKPTQAKKKASKEHEGIDEGDVGGHYGGEGSTDEIDDSPMSGKLKPGQVKAKPDKEHEGIDEGDVGGHYGGEGSTDEIDDSPMSGKLKPGQVKAKSDKEHEGIDEGDVGGHYGGEGSTDEISDDPLSGKVKPSEQNKKGNRKSDFQEDDQGGHYDNESSTDELDRSPLKGKLKSEDPFAEEDDDSADSLVNAKKKKSINREVQPRDEKLRDDAPKPGEVRAGEEVNPVATGARDGVTEFEKNNPEIAAQREEDDLGVDELDRDALAKLKKKQEALKAAGLSDEDINIDELDRDGLDKLKKKREEALKAAGLLEEGDDVDDLAKPEPEAIKALKEKSPLKAKREGEDLGIDELDRDAFEKLKKKQEALKKAGLADDDVNVDELDRDGLDKLKKKRQEALKAAGLLEEGDDVDDLAKPEPEAVKALKEKSPLKAKREGEDLGVDELDRDGLDKLKKKRQEALQAAGLLEEGDDVDDLAKAKPKALDGKKIGDKPSVNELERDGKDVLGKPKTSQEIGAALEDDDQALSKANRPKATVADVDEEEVADVLSQVTRPKDKKAKEQAKAKGEIPDSGVKDDQAKVDAIVGNVDPFADDEPDFDDLIPKKKIGSVQAQAGKDLYSEDETGELNNNTKEVNLDDEMIDGSAQDLSARKAKEMVDALEASAGDNVTDIKNAVIDGQAQEKEGVDPNQEIPGGITREDLKEIFDQEIPVSTESGELNVIIDNPAENISHICKFEDFYTTEIVVSIDSGLLSVEDTYDVKVSLKYAGSKIQIEQKAKAIEIDEYEDGKVLVCLEFIEEIDEQEYNTFSTLYQDRQDSISDFMNLARGYYLEDEG